MSGDTETVVEELLVEVRRTLERKARGKRTLTVTYEDLASEVGPKVGIPKLNARDPRLIGALERLSRSTFDRHRFLLSVLVVNKDTGMPGGGKNSGFYSLAKELAGYPRNISREDVFAKEIEKVSEHYRTRR
jgi:hypothetical protein